MRALSIQPTTKWDLGCISATWCCLACCFTTCTWKKVPDTLSRARKRTAILTRGINRRKCAVWMCLQLRTRRWGLSPIVFPFDSVDSFCMRIFSMLDVRNISLLVFPVFFREESQGLFDSDATSSLTDAAVIKVRTGLFKFLFPFGGWHDCCALLVTQKEL